MGIKSEPIIKNVAVDNKTTDLNANGEIQIKGGSVDRTILNADLQKKTDGWILEGSHSMGANVDLSTLGNITEIKIKCDLSSGVHYLRINNLTSGHYNLEQSGNGTTIAINNHFNLAQFQFSYGTGIISLSGKDRIFFNSFSTENASWHYWSKCSGFKDIGSSFITSVYLWNGTGTFTIYYKIES